MAVTAGTLTIIVLSCIVLVFVIVYISIWMENRNIIKNQIAITGKSKTDAQDYINSRYGRMLDDANRTIHIDEQAVDFEKDQFAQ